MRTPLAVACAACQTGALLAASIVHANSAVSLAAGAAGAASRVGPASQSQTVAISQPAPAAAPAATPPQAAATNGAASTDPAAQANQRLNLPTEPGPTAARLQNLVSDPSLENQRAAFDGADKPVPSTPRPDVKAGAGGGDIKFDPSRPVANPPPPGPATKVLPGMPARDTPPFWDKQTIGFAALGTMTGMAVGIFLAFMLGPVGILIGAILGAALAVGAWKKFGYSTKSSDS